MLGGGEEKGDSSFKKGKHSHLCLLLQVVCGYPVPRKKGASLDRDFFCNHRLNASSFISNQRKTESTAASTAVDYTSRNSFLPFIIETSRL